MSDWAEHQDPSGKTYYYNASTQATSWDRPADFGKGAEVAETPAANGGWVAVADAASGKTYYHNAATGATSWEVPAGFSVGGGGDASTRKDKVHAKRGAIGKKKAALPQTVGEKLAARAKKFVQLRKTDKAKTQPSAFARKRGPANLIQKAAAGAGSAASPVLAAAPAGLPADWQEVKHPDTGQVYYYNSVTQVTSWDRPV